MKNERVVELHKVVTEQKSTFGENETDILIDKIKMSIFQRSIASYFNNGFCGVKYDCTGLTKYSGITTDMYITDSGKKYRVNYVQDSPRYNQVFLERVADDV